MRTFETWIRLAAQMFKGANGGILPNESLFRGENQRMTAIYVPHFIIQLPPTPIIQPLETIKSTQTKLKILLKQPGYLPLRVKQMLCAISIQITSISQPPNHFNRQIAAIFNRIFHIFASSSHKTTLKPSTPS